MLFNSDTFSSIHILVVGDIMLDRYHWGEVRRISPEGPVPVMHVLEKSEVLGGAGNVAANLAGLGCRTTVIGLIGKDTAGRHIQKMLDDRNIQGCLVSNKLKSTITKTRIMAQGQQLIRLDEENPEPIGPKLSDRIFSEIEARLTGCQAVILSDYGKGIFQSPGLCRRIIDLCRKKNRPVLVDPKGTDWERYRNATAVTPNTSELKSVAGLTTNIPEKELKRVAKSIEKRFDLDWLLVTRGAKGMCLFGADGTFKKIPAVAREVFDVSGAGDTVIATVTAALATGFSFMEAAEIANSAAGIVVGKLGTQPVTAAELDVALQLDEKKRQSSEGIHTTSLEGAQIMVKSWRSSGKKVVFTNGCFDLLHPGHINLLHQARSFGDRLIIGLNTDSSIKRLKGDLRPILSEQDRAAILNALDCVDLVVLFDEDTPLELIKTLKPDVLVKGADYKIEEVVGRQYVESYGGEVRLVQLLAGYSTTGIANKVLSAGKNIKKQ
ncbi:MAG: bifunctional D-glycero-beta-D-manno-heptose-7-phosphate kinase/D-glycero-beta-D-manno-heptose 1-phosphate adenylyltransferase HldE [Desulfobacterales bacterium]